MDLTGLIGDIFGKYQAHIFAALLAIIRMQYKMGKSFAVHVANCEKEFEIRDLKISNIEGTLKENKDNIVELFRESREAINNGMQG